MSLPALRPHLAVGLVAVAASVVMTWPLAATMATSVQDLGDPLLQIWTLKWNLHQLARDPLQLYAANTFAPFPQPLAYSESMLATTLLFALPYWLSGNDVLAYNLVVLFTFAASVVTAYALARQLTSRWPAALLAGLAFAFVPYRFGHLSHLNLLSLQWLPLLLLCLVRLLRTADPRWAAAFAVAFLLQALSSFYYAYLAAIACAVLLVVMPPWRDGRPARPRLLGLAAAALAIALVLIPVSLPYFGVRDALGFERNPKEVEELAAGPRDYLKVAPKSRLWEKRLPQGYPNPLFPGAAATALALVGLATARRRLTAALFAVGLAGLLLSFGFALDLGGRSIPMPYGLLYDYLPGARGLRDVARFGVLALLALALLAAAGLGWLCDRVAAGGGRARAWAAHGLAVAACLATLAEFSSGSVAAVAVDRDAEALAPYHWLAAQPRGLVMEFPAAGLLGNSVDGVTRFMYYSTYHWQPLVLGYSGYVPPLHLELLGHFPDNRRTATPSLLTRENVGLLRDLGVRYVLFHRHRYSGGGWKLVQQNLNQIAGLTPAGQYGTTWVYLLETDDRRPVTAELLPAARVVAGRPVSAHFVLWNPNATAAAYGFGGRATLTAAWRDGAGRLVQGGAARFQPGAIVAPGYEATPIDLGPPPPPGDYQLTLTSDDPRVAPALPTAPIAVTVTPALPAGAADPPRLERLSWPARSYRPGETIPVSLTWQATGPLPGRTVFFQLIGPDNRVWGQRDGDPLDGQRPAAGWLAGERVEDRRGLPIKPDAPPGAYRLLVGLYEPATGQRLPILGPEGGAPAPEIWSTAITIAPGT